MGMGCRDGEKNREKETAKQTEGNRHNASGRKTIRKETETHRERYGKGQRNKDPERSVDEKGPRANLTTSEKACVVVALQTET